MCYACEAYYTHFEHQPFSHTYLELSVTRVKLVTYVRRVMKMCPYLPIIDPSVMRFMGGMHVIHVLSPIS